MNDFDSQRSVEELQLLAGTRGRGTGRAAVRLDDLAALLEVSPRIRASEVTGSVVPVEAYNALLQDMRALHEVMLSLANALQERRGA